MRRISNTVASLTATFLMLVGCTNALESEISDLRSRISDLEAMTESLNSSYEALSEIVNAISANDLVKRVEDNGDGTYDLIFASGTSITLRSGTDGEKIVMGIRYDETAGTYYWTTQDAEEGTVKWLYDSTGKRIRASVSEPRFKVEDGAWYYTFSNASYDSETGWVKLSSTSVGEDGVSIFKSIKLDTNGNYMTIELSDGTLLQIPTQKLYDRLKASCDTINANIAAYTEIIESVDSNVFVESVTKIVDGLEDVGYDIVLESGRTLSIRNGRDDDGFVYLGIGPDSSGLEKVWTYSLAEDGESHYIYYNGRLLQAQADDAIPQVGVTDVDGVMYFTIALWDDTPQILTDSELNPVRASPVKFFDSVTTAGDTLVLHLTSFDGSSGRTVNLCRSEEWTPVLQLADTKTGDESMVVSGDEERTFIAYVDSIPSAEAISFKSKYSITAVALDSACVTSVSNGEMLDGRIGGQKQCYAHSIVFRVNPAAAAGSTTRVAVFLNWDDSHTIMKVAEFTVR